MAAGQHRSRQYYKKALPAALWRRVLVSQHQEIYRHFELAFHPTAAMRVVNIGVNADLRQAHRYIFEARYPFLDKVTACGLEEGDTYAGLFPACRYVKVDRDRPLPFDDLEFDLAFCSAVIEHVGDRGAQRAFLSEVLRVAKAAFVTTPNRWYPVELHTLVPLIHYLPASVYRPVYRRLGFDFFSREENLNLLGRRELAGLVPRGRHFEIREHHFLGLPSNLLLEVR